MPYSTQADLEKRIGVTQLAELTNDNANLYVFTVSGITTDPTAGAVYTNNGQTFTVVSASLTGVAGARLGTVTCTFTGVPASSGTLTKSSGTGDATIAFSASTAADAAVVTSLILRADTYIDEELSDIYTVPFSTIPDLIAQFSCDLACYYAMQRRPLQFEIPEDWDAIYERIIAHIQKFKSMEDVLDGVTPIGVASHSVLKVTDPDTSSTDPIFGFNDLNSNMSYF